MLAGLAVVAVGAVLLVGLAWFGQDRLIYHPDRDHPGAASRAADGGTDVTVRTADGLELTAWYVPLRVRPGTRPSWSRRATAGTGSTAPAWRS